MVCIYKTLYTFVFNGTQLYIKAIDFENYNRLSSSGPTLTNSKWLPIIRCLLQSYTIC